MASSQILVIDDEPALRQIVRSVLIKAGYAVDEASDIGEGRARLARGDIDIALCDVNMPGGSGIDLLRETRAAGIDTVFVMITASSSVASAVDALRAGAHDYLMKPVGREELLHRLEQIEDIRGLRDENRALRKVVSDRGAPVFRFTSPGMAQVERLVEKVAPTASTVLILGESGTGKGVLAQTIHQKSPRAQHAFVPVNCSAIPEHLLESEFFGHTKGAFTGAERTRKGLFLEADRGTLFLDEIGELPLTMQTKLLHAIESKQVRPVGSEQARHVDARIIAATNRDLADMVATGTFREDLFFRLGMFQIALPPLRERTADLPHLIRFMLKKGRDCAADGCFEIGPETEAYLLAYSWPGNVRELDNVINRARILAENNCITPDDLPTALLGAVDKRLLVRSDVGGDGTLREQLKRVEADILARAIGTAGGDRRLAARRLGISLSCLYRKLEDPTRG